MGDRHALTQIFLTLAIIISIIVQLSQASGSAKAKNVEEEQANLIKKGDGGGVETLLYCDCGYHYDYYGKYRCDVCYGWSTGAIIGISIGTFLFVIGVVVLMCYFCAWGCFTGRKSVRRGQIYAAPATRQQQPPLHQPIYYNNTNSGYPITGGGGGYPYPYPRQEPSVTIIHNPQYQPPPYNPAAATGAVGAGGGGYNSNSNHNIGPSIRPGFVTSS